MTAPLVVVKGDATAEEVAALVAVVSGMAAAAQAAADTERPVVSEWSAPHRRVRATFPHGPGGWRASGLPR
ncbi:acyl-CoA carboxylase subunit epsilon [Nocardioides caldifontis]|uniref:acyl-CoA carboxylase subunit epsilon n=1 Tax=Nocardioides caldifontis TaxID=2588938 RepID=UPI0011DF59D6|nr:acyl-CoA carboxylase subunit epsilon [Nocardioides caldifontis]